MSKCDSCKYPYDIRKWPCEDCLQDDRYEPKPQTNADRIRAMTDEELAEAINTDFGFVPWCHMPCNEDCEKCIVNWLKQEAANEQP